MGLIISLIILLFSAILHEIAHGAVAEHFGDDTAKMMGRITLNPISHIDPYFSILIPLMLYMSGSPVIFGAAKPVPVNYYRLTNFRWGIFWVSIAGVLTNLLIAFLAALPMRFLTLSDTATAILTMIAQINIFLAVVNLIPIPPIDGSKVLASLLGERAIQWIMNIEMRGLLGILPFIIIIFVLFSSSGFHAIMVPVVNFFFHLIGLV